ncbi:hypothetical protein VTL71DRAFT_9239 [Oculimacula yallundae]|uniref:Uncharacterized protein n=1 Tax=Oculimacula yallundae TaxID=86028 RepID=A0ABR4BSG9_9HELO
MINRYTSRHHFLILHRTTIRLQHLAFSYIMCHDQGQVEPPWGDLPSEKYILSHWNENSSEDNHQQCIALSRQFIQERFPAVSSSDRSTSRKRDILSPWRPLSLRSIVLGQQNGIWLRTIYTPSSDSGHQSHFGDVDWEMMLGTEEYYFFNNSDWYDFGSDWHRIFDYFPELLTSGFDPEEGVSPESRQLRNEAISAAAQKVKPATEELIAVLRGEVEENNVGEQVRTSLEIARMTAENANEVKDFALKDLNDELQCAFVVGFMIVEDQLAIETGEALLVFLDERGKAVRYMREDVQGLDTFCPLWDEGAQFDGSHWRQATVGEDYIDGGVRGSVSMGIVDALLPLW